MKIVFIVFAVLFLVAEVAVCLIKRTVSEKVSGGQAQYDKYKDSLLAKVFASEKLSSGRRQLDSGYKILFLLRKAQVLFALGFIVFVCLMILGK